MASSGGNKNDNLGLKIIAGLLGLGLFLAVFSDGDPDNDAWAEGETAAGDEGDDDVPEVDPDDPWTQDDDDIGPEPGTCDGVAWFAGDDGDVLLPVAGSGTDLPTPSCQLDVTAGGDDDAVALVQRVLADCNGQAVVVDGVYGSQTTQAVRSVQGAEDIAVDGVYGPQTAAVMAWPVGSAPGEVAGEDPLADRPVCDPATAEPPSSEPDSLPYTP